MKLNLRNDLNLTIAEFWKMYSSEYIKTSHKNEIIIPSKDLFCQEIAVEIRDMFYYSDFRHIHLTNEGNVFRIYNPYGRDYDCDFTTEFGYVIIDLYKIICRHYNSLISTIYKAIFYRDEFVLMKSIYPNEYDYFKNCHKCVMGIYEMGYYLDDNQNMHITAIYYERDDDDYPSCFIT